MTGISSLKEYHQAYKLALDVHHKWDAEDERQLLKRLEALLLLVEPLYAMSGDTWHRKQNLRRHLDVMKFNLGAGEKDASRTDIDDLIYADLPALADQLFRIAEGN
ncbi:Unknown protein sequence [Pseudomonas coronafaciens pv. oryzae]|uniref:hypothetical protein n=1 Tax=Pseudomonas coronafaciens TaxID=53409 RepID=UPI0006B5DE7B|nr:hypothetical protein [Pseudomonas coronafaciens]KPB51334.1 Unknown protein sequence [Pseudomonas coronafaciens pv. oryzae]KPY06397.1 Unknown protein sequence [Pseudomonas coronafaciens pv. oryzae]RMT08501.1 hypothetical protein ALP55_03735 [Pseudomonas coronafaciens pv. oryzae]